MRRYRFGPHTKTDLKVHLVWVPKYRQAVLTGQVAIRARDLLRQIAFEHELEVISGKVASDHVHMFIGYRPTQQISKIMQWLKGISSRVLLQVLQPMIDPTFSEFSYGFRPGRSAHDAALQAQRYAQDGYRIVVDVDLEKFFDRVNHDILMERLARRIADKAVLRLIRVFLQAGIMMDGVVMARDEGTPQGGPLSPLLANVLLDEVDRALTQRGHRFARYADDCNVYVRSQKAGSGCCVVCARSMRGCTCG